MNNHVFKKKSLFIIYLISLSSLIILNAVQALAFDRLAVENMRAKINQNIGTKEVESVKNNAWVLNVPQPAVEFGKNADKLQKSGGITLIESINMALANNRNLKVVEKNINLADIKVSEAWHGYDMRVSAEGFLTRLDQATVFNVEPISMIMADKVNQSYAINVSRPLYTGGKVEYGRAMAEKYKDAAVFMVDSAKVNLIYEVKKSFYDILLAQEFVKVAGESLELIKAHMKTVRSRFDGGTASKFDLLRIEVQEANTKPNLIKAMQEFTIARNVFNNVLARPVFYEIEIQGMLKKSDFPFITLEDAEKTALATRQDIAAAKAELDASEYELKIARAGNKPTLAMSGIYEKSKGKATPVDAFNETWNVNMVAQMPIYDGKQVRYAIETARETREQKKINYDQALENVKLEVKTAHQELIQADELITASEKNVEQAREALSIAQVSYDNGLSTNLEIMDAQLALTQTKTNYFQALHDYLAAYAKLEKSMGIGRIAE